MRSSGYILAGGGWCWVMVDLWWLVVGGGIVQPNTLDTCATFFKPPFFNNKTDVLIFF